MAGYADFALDGLLAHNELRQKHGVPDLILNAEVMCAAAQAWADVCAKKGSISEKGDTEYGQNTYTSGKRASSLRDAVNTWYAEGRKFAYGTENVKKKSFHFTQVVWKSTTDLGVGMATSPKGKVFIIAFYYPKGNKSGDFSKNVPDLLPEEVPAEPQ